MLKRILLSVAAIILSSGIVSAAPVFSLIGSSATVGDGQINVTIGSSGGWGFQIQNDNTGWIQVTATDFCPTGVFATPCFPSAWSAPGVEPFGPYSDVLGPEAAFVVAPSDTAQQIFGSSTGAGSIALSRPGILPGEIQAGQIWFVFDTFDTNPLLPGATQIGFSDLGFAVAAVAAIAPVPEPRLPGLIVAGLGILAYLSRRGTVDAGTHAR